MTQRPAVHDYYMALGLKPDASQGEIKRAYRKFLLSWRYPGVTQIGLIGMAVIDDAYETLTNPAKKSRYDREYPFIRRGWMRYQKRKVTAAQAADSSDEEDEEDLEDGDGEEDDDDDESATDDGGPDGEAVDEDFSPDEKWDDEEEVRMPLVRGLKRKRVVVEESDVSEDEEPTMPSRPGLRKLRVVVNYEESSDEDDDPIQDVVEESDVSNDEAPTTPSRPELRKRRAVVHYGESSDEDDHPIRKPNTRAMARRRVVTVSNPDESEAEAEFTDGEGPPSDDDVDEKVDRYADYTTVYENEIDSGSESEGDD